MKNLIQGKMTITKIMMTMIKIIKIIMCFMNKNSKMNINPMLKKKIV